MKKSCNETNNEKSIISFDNEIYFYDEINRENILKLKTLIEDINRELDFSNVPEKWHKRLFRKIFKRFIGEYSPIKYILLHIYSYGGDVDSSINAHDYIENNRYPIVTIAEGNCCSGATIMHQAGYERIINKNAVYLIHQIRGIISGTHEEIKDQLYNWEISNKTLVGIYMKKSKIDEEYVKMLLDNEREIDAETALDLGLVDKIY